MNISNCVKKAGLLFLLVTNNFSIIYAEKNPDPISAEQTEQETIVAEKQASLDENTKQELNIEDFQLPDENSQISQEQLEELQAALANQFSQEQLEQFQADFSKIMDNRVSILTKQTSEIDGLLEELALNVNNEVIGGKNKKQLLEQIKQLRFNINNVKSNAFVEVNPVVLHFLVTFNKILMEHISEAIKNGFTELPAIDEKLMVIQKSPVQMDITKIDDAIEENATYFLKVQKEAHEIGLRWHNKIAQKLSSWLFIAHRRGWDVKFLLGSVTGVLSLYAIMKYTYLGYLPSEQYKHQAITTLVAGGEKGDTYFANQIVPEFNDLIDQATAAQEQEVEPGYRIPWYRMPMRMLRKYIIGFPLICNSSGSFERGKDAKAWNETMVNLFGKAEPGMNALKTLTIGYLSIVGFFYTSYSGEDWQRDLLSWIGRKWILFKGKLLGGMAAKQAEAMLKEDDEMFEPKYTFDDVVGLEHIKELLSAVLEYMKDPERFDRANISPERGYLFTGLPGTGKSFVAEAFGGEIRKAFKQIPGRNEDELGFYFFPAETLNKKGIGYLLNLAKRESPCVIFIDEIDLLRLQRGGGNSELLSDFLSSMSGVLSKEAGRQVVLIAATNRPEHLDKALRRRGRFGKIVHFELPTLGERKALLTKKLEPLFPDLNIFDLDKIAEETEGCTYEELTSMMNKALQKTKIQGVPLGQEHLEDALDSEIRNVINKDMRISEQEQELIAAHQAGHACVRELLKTRRELAAVTIKPFVTDLENEHVMAQYYQEKEKQDVVEYGKTFTRCNFDFLGVDSREEKIIESKILLAGMIAERIVLGSCGHSYNANNKQEALNIVKSLVFEGLHIKTMPKAIQVKYFQQALDLLKQLEQETETLLMEHEPALRAVAQELKKYKTLSARRVKEIIAETEEAVSIKGSVAPVGA